MTSRHQTVTEAEISAVADVLRSDWITQGPKIREFEEAVAALCGAAEAVAFSSGTAALHAACVAAGLRAGDEAITTPLTFVATANAAVYVGATPVFADIDPHTLTLDPETVERCLSPRTRAILPVHFAGLPCDMGRLAALAQRHRLVIIEDACHALGAAWRTPEGRIERVGSCSHSDMVVFSFHPVKHITTGEGGMVLTNRKDLAKTLRAFRHHGITRAEELEPEPAEPWAYEMRFLGYNYRITDFQCALGLKQLERLEENVRRRRDIAACYDEAFRSLKLQIQEDDGQRARHARHLYPVQWPLERLRANRREIFLALREAGLPVNVHYRPVHLQPFYREQFKYLPGLCPLAERYYERATTLPLSPIMTDEDVGAVIRIVRDVVASAGGLG